MIHQLADEKNDIYTDKNSLLKITQKYYKKLFKFSKTNSFKQQKLLKNAVKKISSSDKTDLDCR